MPRRTTPFQPDAYYHVYNRGHNRSAIFFKPENYVFFLKRLRQYIAGEQAQVIAYVLMPNHYHLLVKVQGSDFSHAMQNFSISYAKAINKQEQRSGALFQGAFQAIRVDQDAYLLHLSRYIHLNPVRAGLAQKPQDWVYSSYPEFIGLRQGILPFPEIVLTQFASQPDQARCLYQAFVEEPELDDMTSIAHLLFDKTSEVLRDFGNLPR